MTALWRRLVAAGRSHTFSLPHPRSCPTRPSVKRLDAFSTFRAEIRCVSEVSLVVHFSRPVPAPEIEGLTVVGD